MAKKIQCPVCEFWFEHTERAGPVPDHKPKGDVLSPRNCGGSGKKPTQTRGFGWPRGDDNPSRR